MASRSMDLNLNKQKFENNLLNLKIYINNLFDLIY